jgi:hypothetical protein
MSGGKPTSMRYGFQDVIDWLSQHVPDGAARRIFDVEDLIVCVLAIYPRVVINCQSQWACLGLWIYEASPEHLTVRSCVSLDKVKNEVH